MNEQHICTVCFSPSWAHDGLCDCGKSHYPTLCCEGCDCGSYECAHQNARLVGGEK